MLRNWPWLPGPQGRSVWQQPMGVTANGIAPAYIRTPMITDFLSADQQQQLLEQIPVGRFCEPEEVAHIVSFLVSPLSGFITREIIDINGGLHMD